MEPKTVIFAIVLLGALTISKAATSPHMTTDTPNTTPNATTATPDITTTTPIPETSTPHTEPTQTTPNDTTTEAETSTEPPTTSEPTTPTPTTQPLPEVGTWTVVGGAENLTCMKMSFKGTISGNNLDPVPIPTTAAADSSRCSEEQAEFVLEFGDDDISISVTLNFVMQDKTTSFLWSASIKHNQKTKKKVQILFETPVGKSYQCNKQIIPITDTFNLTLEELRLQPFASFANHDFGEAYSCESPTSSGPNAALVVGLVLGAVIFVLLIVIFVLYSKKKSPGRGYANSL